MTNVLGLPLDMALAVLGGEDVRVEELASRPPRAPKNEDNSAPRVNAARGTLRVVRQKDNVLTVCRFYDDALENNKGIDI